MPWRENEDGINVNTAPSWYRCKPCWKDPANWKFHDGSSTGLQDFLVFQVLLSGKTFFEYPNIKAGYLVRYSALSVIFVMLKNQIAMSKGARACIYYSKFENSYPQWGHPCHQDEAGPCLWCHFRHDDYAPWRTHGRKRSSGVLFPENKDIGLLWWKHPYFWGKTSVLLPKEVRCFASSGPLHRILPSPLYKKSFGKSPTFPTPRHRMSSIYW